MVESTKTRHSRIQRNLDDPSLLVEILASCDGDVDLFAQQFAATDHKSKLKVLQKALMVLNHPDNLVHKVVWDENIAAYKAAKTALAQRTAFEWIGNYRPPKNTAKKPIAMATATQYMKAWLGEHMAAESTRGRRAGSEIAPVVDKSSDSTLKQMEAQRNEHSA
jgi:hypothetical protein